MLSKHKVVSKARKAIELLYKGTCTVTVQQEYIKDNSATGFKQVVVLENEPCLLSFSNVTSTKEGEVAATVSQVTELFISPDVDIAPGSKITITQDGVTTDYTRSGKSALYSTHQQIVLELWKERS